MNESIFDGFTTDKEMIGSGVWMDIKQYEDGTFARIKLSMMGQENKTYQKAIEKAMKPYRLLLANNQMDNDVAENVIRKVFVDTVVLDWENFRDGGEIIPFSKEAATSVFLKAPRLYEQCKSFASEFGNFSHAREADAKN